MVVAPTVAAAFGTLMSLEKACSRLLVSGVDASRGLEGLAAHLLAPCSIAWASAQARDAHFFLCASICTLLYCSIASAQARVALFFFLTLRFPRS